MDLGGVVSSGRYGEEKRWTVVACVDYVVGVVAIVVVPVMMR
jgi:hypothetical protein